MDSKEGDFLDEIFMAEQKWYSDAYREALELSSGTAPLSELPDRSEDLRSLWNHGFQYGAHLGLELYSYQGLAEEVIASRCSESLASGDVGKNHPISIARHLLRLLNESPGPLSRSCEQFVKHPSFEADLPLIRNKAKQLLSALKIHTISKVVENLDF